MLPTDFEGTNIELVKPEDWTDEQCGSMRAWYGEGTDGNRGFLTAWKPSKEDLDALNAGLPLFLRVLGNSFPPVGMFTIDEMGQANV